MLVVWIFCSSFVAIVLSAPSTTTLSGPIPPTCFHNGQEYHPGEEFYTNPCEHCRCDINGLTLCEVQPCRSPSCVDSVQLPDECCPVCPYGPNCRHSDGTIIPSGEKYHPDPLNLTTCYCQSTPLGLHTTFPICETILTGPIPGR